MLQRRPPSGRDTSSVIGVDPLQNGACSLPCGGPSSIYVGFSSFLLAPVTSSSLLSPFIVPTNTHKVQASLHQQPPLSSCKNQALCCALWKPNPTGQPFGFVWL
ncbi:hypothetical protein QL285_078173 [Trifolium repens]|nr:hypothetical protein QL285_078173 [Trifolium repens]